MAFRQYTAAELYALRDSPLAVKPEHLPAIEQWLEYVYLDLPDGGREKLRIPHSEANTATSNNNNNNSTANTTAGSLKNGKRPTLGAVGGESSPMGSFSTGRPTLATRTSTLRANGDDVSLGPPKTMFPSSRNSSKLSADLQERTAASSADATPGDEPDNARSRFFSDRQLNRRSMNNDKESTKDTWTTVRDRREKEKEERLGRGDKDEGERRNGFGDRHDPRWSNNRDERRNGDRPAGGWREREQQRRERDGDRGHAEKEPEWMDDPVVKKDQELGFGMAKTQEEFQKWKESMSKKDKGEPKKEPEPVVEEAFEPMAPSQPEPKPTVAPLKLDGFESGLFGGWGSAPPATSQSVTTPGATAPAKASGGKVKTSRFASMFKPVEEPVPAPAPMEETPIQQIANGLAKTSAEDQEGFNRVLQMLGGAKIGQAPPQPPPPPQEQQPLSPPPSIKATGTHGTAGKPKSRFTDMFAQKSPERLQSPQQGGVQLGGDSMFGSDHRGITDEPQQHFFGSRQPERQTSEQHLNRHHIPPESPMPVESSGIPFNAMREQQPRPSSGRMNDIMFDPPSRGAASPDINIQNLLAQQRQRPHATSNESQQLLNLLKKDSSRPASQQALPNNGGMDQAQLQRWLEHQHQQSIPAEPHAPKPRVPQQPPGLFEEQLMRNYPQEQQRQEQVFMANLPEMPPQRRTSQRAPPGFFDEQSIFLQQQHQHQQQQQQQQLRRQFTNESQIPQQQMPGAGRRMSGHPNLQMQIPPQQQGQQYPSEYHQITSPGGQGPPPPGFNPHMPRHPPGFHNINIFQQPQQREPPPPGFNNLQSPQGNAPPGFFGGSQGGMPPNFMQQMRSPTEGMPPQQSMRGNVGRGYEGFDVGMGPRR